MSTFRFMRFYDGGGGDGGDDCFAKGVATTYLTLDDGFSSSASERTQVL